jgi:acetyltransferase
VIALYLESFVHGRRFIELVTSSDKPVVVLKGGKSPLGAEAAASHTASLAGNHNLVRGVLKQAAVHQGDDFFEMVDIARTLEKDFYLQRPPDGKPRIAIFSYSGASGIVTTDHMDKYGLTLAHFSPQTQKKLEELTPVWMPIKNPVDYYPAMEKHGPALAYKRGLEALLQDPQVDGIIVHLFAGFGIWSLDMKQILSDIQKPCKPILFWLIGPEKGREPTRLTLEEEGWPTFLEIHRTVKVMASLFEDYGTRREPLEISSPEFPILRAIMKRDPASDGKGRKVLDEFEAKKLLKTLKLKVVKEVAARNLGEALRAAKRIGYPIVLKGIVEGQAHKTELGLVKLNLRNGDQLKSAYRKMLHARIKPESFLIQPMVQGDLELIAGVVRDPQFGPAVMLGLGGVRAEVYKDTAFRLAPINQKDVLTMVSDL